VEDEYWNAVEAARKELETAPGSKETLGKVADAIGWTRNYASKTIQDAKNHLSKAAIHRSMHLDSKMTQ
jgi:hypothetical protein